MHHNAIALFLLYPLGLLYALTIDSVIAYSDSCVQIQWTPDTVNTDVSWYQQYGNKCSGTDSIYRHCDFVVGRLYSGIPYSYGGEDSWYTFRERLHSGFLVGSHQCHYNVYGDPTNKITGTDCSGFLCFVWGFPRSNTSTLYNSELFTEIPITEVLPGDALVKATSGCGYHAILIVEADSPAEAVISEASSTVFGCRERIVDLTDSSTWQCYKAIRYSKILSAAYRKNKSFTDGIFVNNVIADKNSIKVNFLKPFNGKITGYFLNGSKAFFIASLKEQSNLTIQLQSSGSKIIVIKAQTKTRTETINVLIH